MRQCRRAVKRKVSIHPPRVGRDRGLAPLPLGEWGFNPPSPCGEGPYRFLCDRYGEQFQSTLPVWGGTAKAHKNSL